MVGKKGWRGRETGKDKWVDGRRKDEDLHDVVPQPREKKKQTKTGSTN